MHMEVEMALFELEYKILISAQKISNHRQKYVKTSLWDKTHPSLSKHMFYYDNTIVVDMHMSPFVAIIGNLEYQALMQMLEKTVSKNDGMDEFFIKDFVRKEEMKEPMSLFVKIGMDNIALVTLDKKNDN